MDSFEEYLLSLLTPKEVKVFQKRYRLAQLLRTKLSYREIARQMSISTTTVVRLNQRLKIRKLKPRQTKQIKNIYINKKLPWKLG